MNRRQREGPGAADVPAERGLYDAQVEEIIEDILARQLEELEERLVHKLAGLLGNQESEGKPIRMITERELADLLRCDSRTVRRLERAGTIPRAVRIGGAKRWQLDTVRTWIEDLPSNDHGSDS